jgi:hypothetical protein
MGDMKPGTANMRMTRLRKEMEKTTSPTKQNTADATSCTGTISTAHPTTPVKTKKISTVSTPRSSSKKRTVEEDPDDADYEARRTKKTLLAAPQKTREVLPGDLYIDHDRIAQELGAHHYPDFGDASVHEHVEGDLEIKEEATNNAGIEKFFPDFMHGI